MVLLNAASLLGLTLVTGAGAFWQPTPVKFQIPVRTNQSGKVLQASLYPPDGTVNVWSGSTVEEFRKEPAAHPVAIVAMYLDWCPHCQRLVPEWSALADAYNGSKGISIAALNCADRVNTEVCEGLNIDGYPTIMCFGCSQSKDLCEGDPCEITSGYDFDGSISFGDRVVNWISKVSKGALQPAHKLVTVPHQHEKVLVIGPPGIPGWIPAYFLRPDKHNTDAMRCLLSVLWDKNDANIASFMLGFLVKVFGAKEKLCHYKDLSVWGGEEIRKLALSLGGKGKKADVRHLVSEFAALHNIRGIGEEPTFATYKDGQLSVSDASHGYQTCLTPTCAMWTFLHVLTTGAAALGHQGAVQVTSGEVLQFVRRFVSEFLSCRECREHFLSRFDTCQYGRCAVGNATDWQGLVMWLWRAHNGVSMRVAAEHDNKEDRRWPSFEDCPTCWMASEVLDMDEKDVAGKFVDKSMGGFDDMFNLNETYGWMILNYAGESTLFECPLFSEKWQLISNIGSTKISWNLWLPAGVAALVALTCMIIRRSSTRGASRSTSMEDSLHAVE